MDLTDKERSLFEAAFEAYSESLEEQGSEPELSLEDLVAYVQANN